MFDITVDFGRGSGPHTTRVKNFSDLSLHLEWIQSALNLDASENFTINIKTVPSQRQTLFGLISSPEGK